jgi:hypothetical protein
MQAQKKSQPTPSPGKSLTVQLNAGNWTYKEGKVEFLTHKTRPAMKIISDKSNIGAVLLKNMDFTDGTIEYDVELVSRGMDHFFFRWQDSANNEDLYLRYYRPLNIKSNDAVQYAPTVKGVLLWDMFYEYQSGAALVLNEWNHVKLVISGRQMRVYVNNETKPTLFVPRLEGDVTKGTLGFDGNVIISNLVVKPGHVENLPAEGVDLTDNDPRYIRNWEVSKPITIPKGVDYSADLYPPRETVWEPIEAERKGMVNLSRKFGKSETRRIVWLKTSIHSAAAQKKKLDLGFSDDVWVFLNGSLVYIDKNTYNALIRKEPDGRISIENASVQLSLKEGNNDLLIGVANDFYGWGLIARLAMKETDAY